MIKFSKSKTWLKRGREELDYYQSEQTYTVVENPYKVSYLIGSEIKYVYVLRRQKFIKNAKNGQLCEFLI